MSVSDVMSVLQSARKKLSQLDPIACHKENRRVSLTNALYMVSIWTEEIYFGSVFQDGVLHFTSPLQL